VKGTDCTGKYNHHTMRTNHWQLKSEMSKENYRLLAEIKFGKPEVKNKSNKIIV
jgi:hypothetical protein